MGVDITGVDISEEMIATARSKSNEIDWFVSSVEKCLRAWHWFDRKQVLQNMRKHLEPNGLLIIINSVFLPDSETAKTTFQVAREHNIEVKPAGSYAEGKKS